MEDGIVLEFSYIILNCVACLLLWGLPQTPKVKYDFSSAFFDSEFLSLEGNLYTLPLDGSVRGLQNLDVMPAPLSSVCHEQMKYVLLRKYPPCLKYKPRRLTCLDIEHKTLHIIYLAPIT